MVTDVMSFNDVKPLVAISACLLGENVRYDGQTKYSPELVDILSPVFALQRVCPEVDAGLPVPRPAVQLMSMPSGLEARGVLDIDLDVTEALTEFSHNWQAENAEVCGAVLKARSPSCGYGTTPVFNDVGVQYSTGNGLFADLLGGGDFPIPVIDEEAWFDLKKRRAFIRQLMFVSRWQTVWSGNFVELIQQLHASYICQFMACDISVLDDLGDLIERGSQGEVSDWMITYYNAALRVLAMQPDTEQYKLVFHHIARILSPNDDVHAGLIRKIETFQVEHHTIPAMISTFRQMLSQWPNADLENQVLLFPHSIEQVWLYD